MKFTDRLLQNWRIAKVRPYITPNSRILDIGSADGVLFQELGLSGMGIDPRVKTGATVNGVPLIAGFFPKDMPDVAPFDIITMLAVLEHFPPGLYPDLQAGCARFLRPGGRLIITVPSAAVDRILDVLKFARLIDGMSLEEHHGYDVQQTTKIFANPDFQLLRRKKFQLGLNNLFVFERTGATSRA